MEVISNRLKSELVGKKVKRGSESEIIISSLRNVVKTILERSTSTEDLLEKIKNSQRPFVIMFFGANGVGKTTTIAKVAYLLKKNGMTSLIAATDTFRAAAQEQLEYHANKLEVPLIKGKYGGDPSAVAFDAVASAKARRYDVVLIDTAGRMHNDKDLIEELRRMVKIVQPQEKILIIDSLAGYDALEQVKAYDRAINFTGLIVTKADADVKGGIILSIAAELAKPIYYLGIGQDYNDLVKFSPEWLIPKLLPNN
ncbi:hypothetical protein HS7_17460 [Sulfolobales archaeon HS-7]|nr:hypothetical protein HS7_17460 [Sulfolobales archaeon HS-7]